MKRLSAPRTRSPRTRRERKREEGQILVLFVLAIVVIMGFTALVIDVGVLRNANQNLWNALDAGALAGAQELPADASNASTIALQYAEENFPGDLPPGVTVGFRCVIGSDGGDPPKPRATDIPAVCDPGANGLAAPSCNATICSLICVPDEGDTCNTLVLEGTATVPYKIGPAVGVTTGTTKNVLSAACKGACGTKPTSPVDLMLVVDRTSSMNGIDTINARAAADAVRKQYNPAEQWMGFGMLGPSQTGGSCITQPAGSIGSANLPADLRRWVPVGLSGAGSPNEQSYSGSGSALAKAINCYTNSSTGTDLSDPVTTAAYELLQHGRSDVIDGIILMSDGQPNNSTTSGPNYCAQSDAAASAAKSQGIEIFTIGFGLDGSNNINCPDTSGFWQGKKATSVLASMATDSVDNLCTTAENDDNDHFYCLPKTAGVSTDLTKLFKQAANALVGGTKLINLPT